MIDFHVAYDKLAQFKADDLALFLEGEGIQAYRADSNSCAISQWMSRTTGEHVSTTISTIFLNADNGTWGAAEDEILLSTEIMDFVTKFDRGDYPNLVASDCPYDKGWKELDLEFGNNS